MNNVSNQSRIVAFGDSYAADYSVEAERLRNDDPTTYEQMVKFHLAKGNMETFSTYCWVNMLSDMLGVNGVTFYSKIGTSIQYTMVKLFEYIISDYDQNDIIIVCLTDPTRSPIVNDDCSWFHICASMLSSYAIHRLKGMVAEPGSFQDNLKQGIAFHEQYHLGLAVDGGYSTDVYCLTDYLMSLPNTVVVLGTTDEIKNTKYDSLCLKNCNNKFFIRDTLIDVNLNEFSISGGKRLTKSEYFKQAGGYDLRFNHLSYENHVKLAEMVGSCILHGDVSEFDVTRFTKNILNGKLQ